MNKMRFILLASLSLLFIVKSTDAQQAKWQTDKYNEIEKLSKFEYFYDRSGKLFYLLTNDKENMYIYVRATDEAAQKKIIIYGFTVEIKTKGANKKKLIIEYPLPKNERLEPIILLPDNSFDKRKNFDLTKDQIVKQIDKIRITGLTDKKESVITDSDNEKNINGNLTICEDGDLQYSLIIPFERLGIDLSENKPMKIKMKSGSFSPSKSPSARPDGMSGKGGGGRTPGMGGGQPGGMGQGRPGGMMPAQQALMSPISISLKKVTLADDNLN